MKKAAGPAVAGRRQRDLRGNQRILEHGNAGLIVASLALGDGSGFALVDLRGAVLAPLVAQRLAVAVRVGEHGGRGHHRAIHHDLDAPILRLAHAVAGCDQRIGLALADHGEGVSRHALADRARCRAT